MKYCVSLFLLVAVCGCMRTLTQAGLDARAIKVSGESPPGHTYYVGSDEGYDYFTIRHGGRGRTRLYSVPRYERAVTTRYVVRPEDEGWQEYRPAGISVNNTAPGDSK